jgi:hypothetical protein
MILRTLFRRKLTSLIHVVIKSSCLTTLAHCAHSTMDPSAPSVFTPVETGSNDCSNIRKEGNEPMHVEAQQGGMKPTGKNSRLDLHANFHF